MKLSAIPVILIVTLSFSGSTAQSLEKQIHQREQLWVGYFNQIRITDKFGLAVDVHYRMTDNFVDRPLQFLVRPAITYYINDNLRLNIGYALSEYFPGKGFNTTRKEHRPWQQIWWNQKYPRLTIVQALRTEQRFNEKITDDVKQGGYNYNFRARYNFSFIIPLKGKDIGSRIPFLTITDEVLLNFGDEITYNTFDQNRFFAGFGYPISSHLNAQVGYMNVYQQRASGNNYYSTHVIRLFVFHTLDFRDKDELK